MRPVGLTLAGLILVGLAAQAQPPGSGPGVPVTPGATVPPAPPPATDPKLDAHLAGWERTMQGVGTFYAALDVKKTESVFKKERKYSGSVLCMKPNFARLRLDNVGDPTKADYEAYICNGRSIFEYNGLLKTITEYKLNPNPGAGGGDHLILDFLGGMKAADAKRRFQMTLFKEDEFYIYLDIRPLLASDRQEFEQVRFALFGPGVKGQHTPYVPAQVYILKPNGDTESWTFKDQRTQVPGVNEKAFEYVPIPGWQFKQTPVTPAAGLSGPGAQPALPGGTGLPPGPGAVRPR